MSEPAPRRSLWAVASLVCALGAIVPICAPLVLSAVVLGVVGIVQTREGRMRGRGLAVSGLVLAVVVGTGWVAFASWWNRAARTPMIEGPLPALQAGAAGDLDAFRAWFHGPGAEADDAVVRAFLDAVSESHGAPLDSVADAAVVVGPAPAGNVRRLRYRVTFTGGEVPCEAEFVIGAPGHVLPILRWGRIELLDAVGDAALVYPPDPVPGTP